MKTEAERAADRQYEIDCEAAEQLLDQRIMTAGLMLRLDEMAWQAAQIGYRDSTDRAEALRDYAIDQAGVRFNKTLDRNR